MKVFFGKVKPCFDVVKSCACKDLPLRDAVNLAYNLYEALKPEEDICRCYRIDTEDRVNILDLEDLLYGIKRVLSLSNKEEDSLEEGKEVKKECTCKGKAEKKAENKKQGKFYSYEDFLDDFFRLAGVREEKACKKDTPKKEISKQETPEKETPKKETPKAPVSKKEQCDKKYLLKIKGSKIRLLSCPYGLFISTADLSNFLGFEGKGGRRALRDAFSKKGWKVTYLNEQPEYLETDMETVKLPRKRDTQSIFYASLVDINKCLKKHNFTMKKKEKLEEYASAINLFLKVNDFKNISQF